MKYRLFAALGALVLAAAFSRPAAAADDDCKVCLYENIGFGGASHCFDPSWQSSTNLKGYDLNDKVSSVKLSKKACPALEVVLYDNDNYQGKRVVLAKSAASIGSELNDKVTSFQAFPQGFGTPNGAPDCGICLFDQPAYFGENTCWDAKRSTGDNEFSSFNDKAQSLKVYKKTCPDLAVMLYENKDYQGRRARIAGDMVALGDMAGKVSSVEVFAEGLADPKDCGICLYEDYSFKGSEYCTAVNESNLATQTFNDKTSSIRLYKKTCPKLSITVFDKKDYVAQYGTKVRFVGDSIGKIPDSLNDKISSITLHPEGDNDTDPVKLTGGCGACVYEDDGFVGRHLCLKDDELREEIDTSGQLRIPNQTAILENDKVSSVWVERSTCRKGKAVLYEDKGFAGNSLALEESVNDLKNKHFDDKVSSFKFSKSGDTASPNATNGCGICLYEEASFKGANKCFDRDVTSLKDYDFNDKASSVKLDRKKCPKLAVQLWDASNFAVYDPPYDPRFDQGSPDEFRLINASLGLLGGKLNDKISSFRLYPNGFDGPWAKTNGCGTCLFQHEDYSGPWACTTGSIADLGTTPVKRDKATSIWIDKKKCPDAQATLFKDRNLGGDGLTLTGSVGNLSGKGFGDTADSVVFDKTGTQAATAGAPDCGICLYEETDYRGQRLCLEENKTEFDDLKQNGFGDKASSVKLFRKSCPLLDAELFKDKDFKGTDRKITGDDRDLGQLKGEVSSLKLYRWSRLRERNGIAGCGWCIHDGKDFSGGRLCQPNTKVPTPLGGSWPLRDKASSVQIFRENCPSAELWLYDKDEVGTGNALILGGSANLPPAFDNKVRQAIFIHSPKSYCGFCAYDQPNYKGQGLCLSSPNDFKPGRLTIPARPDTAGVLAGNIRSLKVNGSCRSLLKVMSGGNTFTVTEGAVPDNEGKWTLPVSQVTTQ